MTRAVLDVIGMRGRIGPTLYTLWTCGLFLLAFCAGLLAYRFPDAFFVIFGITAPPVMYLSISACVRRLHDLGRQGMDAFGLFVPIYNIGFFNRLSEQAGSEDANIYGPSPRLRRSSLDAASPQISRTPSE